MLNYEDLIAGVPIKTKQSTAESLDGKAFRVGYQTAKLAADREMLEKAKAEFMEQQAKAVQMLMQQQQQLAQQGANVQVAGQALAGLASQGMGMGQPPMPGGPMPMEGPAPMPGGPMPMSGPPPMQEPFPY